MATLMDYQDKGVMDPERFYAAHKGLSKEEYKAKIIEMYGPATSRDKKMGALVNVAVLAYVFGK
ncbi:MAG: hypothetical protein FWD92_05945 [Methanomassiliicoccaceae archaeon]|nr:hypothetical protein [Methanomassiliicoccaceae archaeon]